MDTGLIAAILAPFAAIAARLDLGGTVSRRLKTLDHMIATYKSLDEKGLEEARSSLGKSITARSKELEPSAVGGRVKGSREPGTLVAGLLVVILAAVAAYYFARQDPWWTTLLAWTFGIFAGLFLWSALDVFFRGPVKNRPKAS